MTASTPWWPSGPLTTATPPPPAATTTNPASMRARMAPASRMSIGSGEGPTGGYPGPESSTIDQPRRAASSSASPRPRKGPIGLVGWAKAGSAGWTVTWVTTAAGRTRGHPDTRRSASEMRLPICPWVIAPRVKSGWGGTTPALSSWARARLPTWGRLPGPTHTPRPGAGRDLMGRGRAPDLGAVAVADDHAPAGAQQGDDRAGHDEGVGLLLLVGPCLTRPGEGVAAERDDRDL